MASTAKKRMKLDASTSFALLRAWIQSNYEYRKGSFVSSEDVLSHLGEDGVMNENISKKLLTRGFNGVFGGDRTGMKGRLKNRIRGYRDVTRKVPNPSVQISSEDEWEVLSQNYSSLSVDADLSHWSAVKDNDCSISFLHFEGVRCDEQRVVSEISFQKNSQKCDIKIGYHQRAVPSEQVQIISDQFTNLGILGRAKELLRFLDRSYICQGFEMLDDDILNERSGIRRHHVSTVGSTTSKERGFSLNCQVLTTSEGVQCASCQREKTNLTRLRKRQNDRKVNGIAPNTNNRYLSRQEIVQKVQDERKRRLAADRARENIHKEMLHMEEEDHSDLEKMMNNLNTTNVPEDMVMLWNEQKKIVMTKNKKQYRWHPKIMKLCVELYCKNPHVLDPLRNVICLPSNRTIRHYKNKVDQKPGWHRETLKWCLDEAKAKNLREQDYWGGFVLDEMKIQEDVQMVVKGGKHRLVGFVDLGKIHDDMQTITEGGKSEEPKLASHVLQFIFLGDSGFRFPIAQFPSSSCSASDLQFIFWEGVNKMLETGFTIYYCILDGAEVNRQFIKIHFQDENEAITNRFVCTNPYNFTCPMIFLMDPKHNIKKLRNNILKSDIDEGTRCLSIGQHHILWEQFRNAYNFDQGSFSLSLNERLTAEHFYLTPASKMRNHLAEEVLDKKMLSLMKAYKEHLRSKPGQDDSSLDATIQLLSHSSKMVQIFNDKMNISSISDSRLKQLREFQQFLDTWKLSTEGDPKKFLSPKLYFDLQSMFYGFQAIVSTKTKFHKNAIVKPAIINQDVVENHFCQVRACNGQNANPTWKLQEAAQNTIRFGQSTISRKSNAGLSSLKKSK